MTAAVGDVEPGGGSWRRGDRLAVVIRLPDDACCARLLVRHLDGLDIADLDVDEVVHRTAGVSASFLKELGRRAALVAAEATPDDDALVARHADVIAAVDDLLVHSTPVPRRSLGAEPGEPASPPTTRLLPPSSNRVVTFEG